MQNFMWTVLLLSLCCGCWQATSGTDEGSATKSESSRATDIEGKVAAQNKSIASDASSPKPDLASVFNRIPGPKAEFEEFLVKYPEAALERDPDNRTPLMIAAFFANQAAAEQLIAAGAEVDAKDRFGRTALMYAATCDSAQLVKMLIDQGADVQLADAQEGWTALMLAASEGKVKNVRHILSAGAKPSTVDQDGQSALDFAKQKNYQDIVFLLQQAAGLDNRNR